MKHIIALLASMSSAFYISILVFVNRHRPSGSTTTDFLELQAFRQFDASASLRSHYIDTSLDAECPFRNSSIYRKVFVYPNHGDVENGWNGSILSEAGRRGEVERWPWLRYDEMARKLGTVHYNVGGSNAQFATEQLVQELLTNPSSCLRTHDPEEATLFYVPFLASTELRRAREDQITAYFASSSYGDAILDILDKGDYKAWEDRFGLTSKYWKRRNGR